MIPHTSCVNALPTSTYHALVIPWLQALERNEIVAVVSYPGSDRERRLTSLIGDTDIQKKGLSRKTTPLWLTIDLRLNMFSTRTDLETYVQQKLKGAHATVILSFMGAEMLLSEAHLPLLLWVSEMVRSQKLKILLFFEANIFSVEALDVLKLIPNFQPRIYNLSLYSDKDIDQFIIHMQDAHGYNFPFDTKIKAQCIAQCGGNLGLMREILHYLRENPSASLLDIFSHREMRFTLSSLWNAFGPLEKELLQTIASGRSSTNHIYKAAAEYLVMTGFIKQYEKFYIITVPLLQTFITESIVIKKNPEIQGENILIDGVYITAHFSHAEKQIFAYLITHADELITRDTLASLMWGRRVNLKYSDWAIDSTLSRLRKKIVQFGLSKERLQTKKGQGVIYKSY